jgi:hypothetical protein
MTTIALDFSNLPSDVALLLSQQQHSQDLADDLARCMSLAPDDRQLIHQEIVGSVARIVDEYLAVRTPAP